MMAIFNPESLIAEALQIVRKRRAKLAAGGHEGEGIFKTGAMGGGLLVLAGEFDAPYRSGGWKVLCCIPSGATHAETAPGLRVKAGRAGLAIIEKPVKARPKVLAEALDRKNPEALADIIDRLAPPMVKINVRPAGEVQAGAV